MNKLIFVMLLVVGCGGESGNETTNSGGFTNGGSNTGGSDNGGSDNGGSDTGGRVSVDSGGAVEVPIEKPPVVKPPVAKEPICSTTTLTNSQGSERLNSTLCFVTSDYTCTGYYDNNNYIVHCNDYQGNWCQAVPLNKATGVFVCGSYGQEYGTEIGAITQANDGKYHLTSDNKLLATCAVMGDVMTVCVM